MKPLLIGRGWSLVAHWHSSVCSLLPSLNFIEEHCGNENCDLLHGVAVEIGWLWGSLIFEIQIG